MQLLSAVLLLLCISQVFSYPAHVLKDMIAAGTWAPPGPGDIRGPCPGLNTLANYGYLPRNGKNITLGVLTSALENVYNMSSTLATALSVNGILQDGHHEVLSLDQLDNHATLEHDASMTRNDYYYGDNYSLNQTLLSSLLSSSSDGNVLTEKDFAAYQSLRQRDSRANNPSYTFGLEQITFASGEPALILSIFGNVDSNGRYNISLTDVKTFLGLEKFPDDWTSAVAEVTTPLITSMSLYISSHWTD